MDKYLKLAKEHGGKTCLFKALPKSHQMAIVWYMAVDGEAWEAFPFNSDREKHHLTLKKLMPLYVHKYGRCRFGVVDIPVDVMKQAVMSNEGSGIGKDFKTFEEYHKWYAKYGIPKHSSKDRWPCILDSCSQDEYWEVLEDGWHRFHSYIKSGHKTIPCIYYLPKVNYKKI